MILDYLVYHSLLEAEDYPFIQSNNIQFINDSIPLDDVYGIYIGHVGLEKTNGDFDSLTYTETVDIYIKTKQVNYFKASRYYRTILKEVHDLINTDTNLIDHDCILVNSNYEYGETYTPKGLHILIQGTVNIDNDYNDLNGELGIDLE